MINSRHISQPPPFGYTNKICVQFCSNSRRTWFIHEGHLLFRTLLLIKLPHPVQIIQEHITFQVLTQKALVRVCKTSRIFRNKLMSFEHSVQWQRKRIPKTITHKYGFQWIPCKEYNSLIFQNTRIFYRHLGQCGGFKWSVSYLPKNNLINMFSWLFSYYQEQELFSDVWFSHQRCVINHQNWLPTHPPTSILHA